jgi:hypothetical protein
MTIVCFSIATIGWFTGIDKQFHKGNSLKKVIRFYDQH